MLKIIPKNNYKLKKIMKERNAGVDFCRIIGMIDIIVYHIVICKYLMNKYKSYSKQFKLIEILTQWHISNFGIISGLVGFKTNKYSNLLYLFLCVLFYSVAIHYIIIKFYKNRYGFIISQRQLRNYFFPVITNDYWYFSTYFKMYLFLPLINKGISLIYKGELIIIILSIIGILFIWKDLISPYPNKFCSDRSAITLLAYFIIGAYFGKYNLNDKKNKNIFYYLYLIILFCSISYITNYLMYYNDFSKCKLILKRLLYNRTNSIAMVLQSTSIILLFIKIKYNKCISKIISFLGSLSFSSYLIHNHMDLRPILIPYLFEKTSISISFANLVILFVIKGTLVFISCIFIDYLRSLLFSFFKIRQICLYFEKIILSLCSKINENENI